MSGQPAGGVYLRVSKDLRALGEPFPSKAVPVLDDPAAVNGLPQKIDGTVRRQTRGGGLDLGADDRFRLERERMREGRLGTQLPSETGQN